MLDALFQPFRIGQTEVRNRIVMPPMVTFLANESGAVTQRMIDYYTERAKGGAGLIIIESAYVQEKDRDFGRLGIENPQLQVGLSELAESIQEQGAKVLLQINNRGSALAIHKGKGPDDLTGRRSKPSSRRFPPLPGAPSGPASTGWRSMGPTFTSSPSSFLP